MKYLILSFLFITLSFSAHAEKNVKIQNALDQRAAEFAKTASEGLKKDFAKGVEEVAASGVLDSAKRKGDVAPNIQLNGKNTLYKQLETGPVILTWYRGGWCPYCNIYLKSFIDKVKDIKSLGAELIAISPEKPSEVEKTIYKNKLNFISVSDEENKAGKQFGIVYTLPKVVSKRFEGRIDVKKSNDSDVEELPLAVTYVIAQDGTIAYSFINPDYRKRAEPTEVIEALKNINEDGQ